MALTKITSDVIETGSITSDKLASGAVSASSLSSITTDNVSEGSTNTYFTNARARGAVSVTGGNLSYDSSTGVLQLTTDTIRSAISAGTGVTYSTGQISIGQDVSTTATPTFGNITTTGYIAGPATFTIDPAAVGDNTGTVVIAGNLQVDGTTTTINSTTMTVDDLNITLASGALNAAAANGAGITVDGASATITYDGTNDEWDFNKVLHVTTPTTAIRLTDSDNTLVYHEIVNDSNTGLSIKVDQGNANGSSYFRTLIDGSEYLRLTPTDLELKTNIDFQKQDGMSISTLESLVFKINSAGGQTARVFQFNDNATALMSINQGGDVSIVGTLDINDGAGGSQFNVSYDSGSIQIEGGKIKLHRSTSYDTLNTSSAQYPYIEWRDSSDVRGSYLGWGEYRATPKYIQWHFENSHNLYISGGKVGIGTNNPQDQLTIENTSGYELGFVGNNTANIRSDNSMHFLADVDATVSDPSLGFGVGASNWGQNLMCRKKSSTGTNGSATTYNAVSVGTNLGGSTLGNYNGPEPMAPFHVLAGGLTMNGFNTPGTTKYAHDTSDSGQWMHMNTMGRSGSGVANFELYIPTAQTTASWGSFGGDLFLSGYNGNWTYIIWKGYTNGGLAGAGASQVSGSGSPTITVGQNGTYGFYIRVTNLSYTHPIAMYRVCKGGNSGREWDLSEISGRWY